MRPATRSLSVFQFLDAREFLKQAYLSEKRANPAFSQRYIAQAMKATSSSFFRQLLAGKSRLTRARVLGLARLFRLSKPETAYLEELAAFTEAEGEEEKRLAFEKLKAADTRPGRHKLLEASQMEYFGKWHYAVVRELLAVHDFRGDYAELGNLIAPPLSAAEARAAVDLLLRLKLIRKNAQGGYHPTDRVVLSGLQAAGHVRPALRDHLDLARRALETFPAKKRPFSYATLSVSEKSVAEIHERFQAFRREAFDIVSRDDQVDRLYQLNFQLFPVSKPIATRKK